MPGDNPDSECSPAGRPAMSGFVGLTFDDGPNPATTGPLLRVLGAAGARATFFDLGNRAAEYPALVKPRVGAGMWHGNHSYTHPRLTDLALRDAYRQITRTQRALRRAIGEAPRLFRPPYGARDARTTDLVRRLGLTEVMWTVDTIDWRGIESTLIV